MKEKIINFLITLTATLIQVTAIYIVLLLLCELFHYRPMNESVFLAAMWILGWAVLCDVKDRLEGR